MVYAHTINTDILFGTEKAVVTLTVLIATADVIRGNVGLKTHQFL